MLVCEQMILTVLIISVALRAEAELQIRVIKLRSATDRAFMACDAFAHLYLLAVCPLSVDFLRGYAVVISCREEKYDEIKE